MKNKIREVVIEDLAWQIVNPTFDKRNLFIGNVIQLLSLWEKAADKRVFLFVRASPKSTNSLPLSLVTDLKTVLKLSP